MDMPSLAVGRQSQHSVVSWRLDVGRDVVGRHWNVAGQVGWAHELFQGQLATHQTSRDSPKVECCDQSVRTGGVLLWRLVEKSEGGVCSIVSEPI